MIIIILIKYFHIDINYTLNIKRIILNLILSKKELFRGCIHAI